VRGQQGMVVEVTVVVRLLGASWIDAFGGRCCDMISTTALIVKYLGTVFDQ